MTTSSSSGGGRAAALRAAPAAAPERPAADGPLSPVALAFGARRTGRLLGLALIVSAVWEGAVHGAGLRQGLPWVALFGGAAAVLLFAGAWLADRAFLGDASRAELARGNVAAGLVGGAHAAAVGLLIGRCLYGADLETFQISSAFFAIAFATLLGFQRLYRLLTRYADDQEVRDENVAAALSFGGVTIAIAIVVGHAVEGTFEGWATSLRAYGLALLVALALYPVRELVVRRLLLALPCSVDRAIDEKRSVVVGAIEGLAYVAIALLATGIA